MESVVGRICGKDGGFESGVEKSMSSGWREW